MNLEGLPSYETLDTSNETIEDKPQFPPDKIEVPKNTEGNVDWPKFLDQVPSAD